MYEKCFKRILDLTVSVIALFLLFPILCVLALVGAIVLKGNPFFVQPRPGKKGKDGKERIFYLIKFRTMNNQRDASGKLLPDAKRLGKYGKFLRKASLDELPSLLNIIVGELSLVGPRPQLVRDMTFMSAEQRRRHNVRPGLTGLAQVNGRNRISWEEKLSYDLQYIDGGITFAKDVKILLKTVVKVLQRCDIVKEGTVSDVDYGDWLLGKGEIDKAEYETKQTEAKDLLGLQ